MDPWKYDYSYVQTIHLVQEDPYYEKIPYQSYQVINLQLYKLSK